MRKDIITKAGRLEREGPRANDPESCQLELAALREEGPKDAWGLCEGFGRRDQRAARQKRAMGANRRLMEEPDGARFHR
jgi:hypothetical protein